MKSFLFFSSLVCVSVIAFGIEGEPEDAVQENPQLQQPVEEAPVTPTPRTAAPQSSHAPQRPNRTLTTTNLCNSQLSVEANPAVTPTQNGRAISTCEMMLDSQFAEAIQTYVPLCAKSAAAFLHWAIPTHVTIQQMGGFADRKINTPSGPGNSWSRHSVGKALDISALIMSHGGVPYKIDLTSRTKNQNFYDAFRTCWDNSVQSMVRNKGQNCTCSIGHTHTHKPSNNLHDNHMHISLTCPQQRGVAGC